MKPLKYPFFILLLFRSVLSFGQEDYKSEQDSGECSRFNEVSTLGIGMVIAPDSFTVYNDSLLKSAFQSLNINYTKTKFCPMIHIPGYGKIHFVCIGKTAKAYKVIVNYSEIKYLPIKKEYNFKTWEEYLLSIYGGITPDSSDYNGTYLILKKEPGENSDTIKINSNQNGYCPTEVKGDWVKIIYNCWMNGGCSEYPTEECKNPLTGWIRWRKNDKLLIGLLLLD